MERKKLVLCPGKCVCRTLFKRRMSVLYNQGLSTLWYSDIEAFERAAHALKDLLARCAELLGSESERE